MLEMFYYILGKIKKYMVINSDGKMVHFGEKGYADYTAHKDE